MFLLLFCTHVAINIYNMYCSFFSKHDSKNKRVHFSQTDLKQIHFHCALVQENHKILYPLDQELLIEINP